MEKARLVPLFSGSSGNAALLTDGRTHLLVDAGVSARRLVAEIRRIGENPGTLTALLVTHDHADHTAGVGVLARRLGLPVCATAGTWRVMGEKAGPLPPELVRVIEPGRSFVLGGAEVLPFSTSHDAAEPVGFSVVFPAGRVSVATDMGVFSDAVFDAVKGSGEVLLEANYDEVMLREGAYPYPLKRRILSARGHLSNRDAAEACLRLASAGVQRVVLGHLSRENNTPSLAYGAAAAALEAGGVLPGRDLILQVANRDGATFTADALGQVIE